MRKLYSNCKIKVYTYICMCIYFKKSQVLKKKESKKLKIKTNEQ